MNKKHREAFRELRDWCKKYDAIISCYRQRLTFDLDISKEGQDSYSMENQNFSDKTEMVYVSTIEHHSISSEGGDEFETGEPSICNPGTIRGREK